MSNWITVEDCLKGRERAVERERERIIELLEENTGCGYQHRENERCFCDAIALIKGETNE